MSAENTLFSLRKPGISDSKEIHSLVHHCKPLDLNSLYSYLLIAHHFRDTSVVTERNDNKIVGFISGYRPPETTNTIFIWQVAVHQEARRHGLAKKMLRHILEREESASTNYLETTVTPSNLASARLFRSLAEELNTESVETELFPEHLFDGGNHESEILFRIGPFH